MAFDPPRISAIIPLYNGERYIENALKSVLNQTLPPVEIIVVDDGSTDRGPDLVRAMGGQTLSKPNGGQSAARNFGAAHATGDLIAFLDQDDIWYPRHLELLAKSFQRQRIGPELGWTYSDFDEIDRDGGMVCQGFLALRSLGQPHPKRDVYDFLSREIYVIPSASLIALSAFQAVGGFDERLLGYEDDDLFLRLFRAGYGNEFIRRRLTQWRLYPESASYTDRMRKSRAIYCRKLLQEFPDDPAQNRFPTRDVILPRFYRQAVFEYVLAGRTDDQTRIAETRAELQFLCDRLPSGRGVTGKMLLRAPLLMKTVIAMRRVMRKIGVMRH